MTEARVLPWNTDKNHRCPGCHAVAVDMERPSRWRVYTCCSCGSLFARWPAPAWALPKAGVRCAEHRDRVPFRPGWTLRPGAALDELLGERNLGPDQAAAVTGPALEVINGILAGGTEVSESIAAGLARLGPSARYWLNYQANYQADLACGAKDVSGRRVRRPRRR